MEVNKLFTDKIKHYAKNCTIITPGNGSDSAWFIKSGRIRQYDILANGDEITLNVYKAGSVLSLTWLLGGMPNRCYFEAEIDSEIQTITAERYREFLQQHPEATYTLLCNIARGFDGIFSKISTLSSGSARLRLLNAIYTESARFGETSPEGKTFIIQTQVLAKRAGLSRETTSRQLKALQKEGIIEKVGKKITLKA